jgi:gliding motility-associated-like protein
MGNWNMGKRNTLQPTAFRLLWLRFCVVLGMQLLFLPGLFATHIVGGQIGYRHISGNTYEIILDVYRDCSNPLNELFDNVAYVGVYNLAGNWVQNILMPFTSADTLNAILSDACLNVPPNVCVATTKYRGTITLPSNPIGGGYRFSYVRCCRNGTINNIVAPLESGAVYDIVLTTAAMQRQNSSPRFRSWPPIFVCVNNPISYNHSAVDSFQLATNMDSLVYRLCQPLSGGSLSNPRPIPPQNPPPFDSVVWRAPIFSVFNMLGNNGDTTIVLTGCTTSDTIVSDSLEINPFTGIVSGTPTIQGQFVVGVCVDEYDRNTGQLLSTTRRDFQYNVGVCDEVLANFTAPAVQCDSLSVQFSNTSLSANDFIWYFDFPSPSPSSTLRNPLHTYQDTGVYTIALVAEPSSVCIDTFCTDLRLVFSALTADFNVSVFDCENFSVLGLQDLSVDNAAAITSWNWTVTFGSTTLTSSLQNPFFQVPLGVSGTVRLRVRDANTCMEELTRPFTTGFNNPGNFIQGTIFACNGETIPLNPNTPANIGFSYLWSPAIGLLDPPNTINPRIVVNGVSQYSVTISSPGNICQIVKTITVVGVPAPNLNFVTSPQCDGLTVNFINTSANASSFIWNFGDPQNPNAGSNLESPSYSYSNTGVYLVTLTVPDTELCRDTIIRPIVVQSKLLSAEFDVEYLSCTPDSVRVRFIDRAVTTAAPIIARNWDFGNGQLSTLANPEFTYFTNTTLQVSYTVIAADGCSNTMSRAISIRLIDPEDFDDVPAVLAKCSVDSLRLPMPLSTAYFYSWSPTSGIDDPTSNDPVFSPTQSTQYTLTIGLVSEDTCYYSLNLLINVPDDLGLQITGDGVTCEASTTLSATTDEPAGIIWINAFGDTISTTSSVTVPVSGTDIYTAIATDQFACITTETVTVAGGPLDVDYPSLVAVCLGEALNLVVTNNDPNDTLRFIWTPADAFVPGTDTNTIPDFIETPGERTVYFSVSNQFGCLLTDSIQTVVVDSAFQLAFTPEYDCDGYQITFSNTSTNAFGFFWDFGDGTTSLETNPVHTYAADGIYTVLLTLRYAVNCIDTVSAEIRVEEPRIQALFNYEILECRKGSADVGLFDVSINSFNNTNQWQWTFSNGQSSTLQNPVISVQQSGSLIATLTITTENNCTSTVTDTLNIQLVEFNLADTVRVCPGGSAPLNPGGDPQYIYLWAPATGLSDPTSPNPIASPAQTTVYTVSIQAVGGDTCSIFQQVTAFVPPNINLVLPADVVTCGEDVLLNPSASVPVLIEWTDSQGNILGGPNIVVNPFQVETYTATATDAYNCSETGSVTVVDNGVDIEVVPTGEATACEDVPFPIFAINLDTSDVLTYQWRPDSLIISGQGTPNIVIRIGPGGSLITGIFTNQFGCRDTAIVNMTIVPFTVSLPDTVWICAGEPAGISPGLNPDFSYVWSPTTDLDFSLGESNPIYRGDSGGLYSVTITDTSTGILCQTERNLTVLVTPKIGLNTTGDTTVCRLGDVSLFAFSNITSVFTWSAPGLGDFATGTPINFNVPEAGIYQVQVIATTQGAYTCRDTSTINILVADFQPGSLTTPQTLCENTPIPLNPDGNPLYTYIWSPTSGLDLSNPFNPVAVVLQPTLYRVTVTDPGSGCNRISEIQVNVFPSLNLEVTGDTILCRLGNFTLDATTDVPGAIGWYRPGNSNPVFSGSPYLVVLDAPGFYDYIAIAEDANGCRDTAQVQITAVDFQPGPLNSPQTLCTNTPTPLNPGGNPAYIYNWSPLSGLDLSDPSNPLAVINGSTNYSVTVTEPVSGCNTSQNINLNIFQPLNISASPDTLLCEVVPVLLEAFAEVNATFSWFVDGFNNPVGSGSQIIVTPGIGIFNYLVIGEDINGCTDTTAVRVSVFELDTGIRDSITVCRNTPTPINPGGNPAYVYVWSPTTGLDVSQPYNPIINTNENRVYSVTITEPALGCNIVRQMAVSVFPATGLTASGTLPDCRIGEIATLSASSVIAAGFEWANNPAFTPLIGSGATVTTTPPVGANTYYVRATDVNGCQEIQTVTINNFPIVATITPPVIICAPQITTPIGVVNLMPDQILTYNWTPRDAVNPATGSPVVTVNASLASTFSVVLVNQYGCRDTLSTTVNILDLPALVSLEIDPDTILLGETSQLEVLGCNNCDFVWTPNNGSLDNNFIRDPEASPEITTQYTVVVSRDGCSATLTGTVFVNYICDEPYIFFPSAFTPNGDGQNDVLRLRGRQALILEAQWVIYNRWGERIFEARNPLDEWDGTYKGKELPPDVFGFHLSVGCPGGVRFTKRGSITLLR